MRPGGSKRKGNKFEWDVSKALGKWYYNDENAFVRTPSSGSVATFRRDRDLPCGDVMQVKYTEDPFGIEIECKHLKDVELLDLLSKKKSSPLLKAWEQTLGEISRIPLLIYCANYKPTFCVTTQQGWMFLLSRVSMNIPHLLFEFPEMRSGYVFLFEDMCSSPRLSCIKANP
jgi:hypothetical protein